MSNDDGWDGRDDTAASALGAQVKSLRDEIEILKELAAANGKYVEELHSDLISLCEGLRDTFTCNGDDHEDIGDCWQCWAVALLEAHQ